MMKKHKLYLTVVLTSLVVFIPLLFPFQIKIIDALNLDAANQFGIQISFWRILFEPFAGIILFFNRGLYSLSEQYYLVIWLVLIFMAYSIFRAIKPKGNTSRKRFLLVQLANLPLVFGIWLSLFAAMLFASIYLPFNTIVNNTSDQILVTTHSHSHFSHDGLISQENLWEWHKKNNFDAFFITDHNTHTQTLNFKAKQRNGDFPITPLVMAGEEFSGSNHLSLLGLQRDFDTHDYTDERAIDSTRNNHGAIITNHWFDGEHKTLAHYRDLGVDGFEIENSALNTSYDRKVYERIKTFCVTNELLMNAGLDFHGYGNVCTMWNALTIPQWDKLSPEKKEEAIISLIKNRDQSNWQVLVYNDRPSYTQDQLFWVPTTTLFNYFRTLNIWQVVSWIIWILVFGLIQHLLSKDDSLESKFSSSNILSILALIGGIFILSLSYNYYSLIPEVAGSDNDIYIEYAHLLFKIGAAVFIYSSVVGYFRFFKNKAPKKTK